MKVVMYMAMSVNGYIAREDGTEDFLSDQDWKSMVELAQKYKNIIVGRKTYEINQTWTDEDNLRSIKGIRKVVVSNQPNLKMIEGFELSLSPEDALSRLSDYQTAFLIGGGTLNGNFATKGLIDEIVLNVEPALIGKGRQVFAGSDFDLRLRLLDTKQLNDSLVQLRYEVVK